MPRVSLIRLLRAVCAAVDPLLRIEASAGCVTLVSIDIEVRPSGIRVGRTKVSRDGWEISLFANPASASKRMRLLSPAGDNASDLETQMLLPFVTPRALKPTPPPAQRGPEKL